MTDLGIFELCEIIDATLLDGIKENSYLHKMYTFFDSVPGRPLNPREFYEFLGSLQADDYPYYMSALN